MMKSCTRSWFPFPVSYAALLLALLCHAPSALAVVGGKAVSGTADWHAALIDLDRPLDAACTASGGSENFCKQFCSASLIASRWVLTAAHCVDGIGNLSQLRVALGTRDLNDPAIDLFGVANKFIPSEYGQPLPNPPHQVDTPIPYRADIALLRLDRDAAYPYAPLADNAYTNALLALAPTVNDEVSQAGWGRLSATGDFPVKLQEVSFDLFALNDCSSIYNPDPTPNYETSFLPDSMLCASEEEAASIEPDDAGDTTPDDPDGEGSCVLDSGSGLLGTNGDDSYLLGIVSFGALNACGNSAYPTVYTRVDRYMAWMEAQATTYSEVMGDLALEVSVPANAAPGQAIAATAKLTNRSGSGSFSPPDFSLATTTGATLSAGTPSGVSCDPVVAGVLTCHSLITLYPGGQVSIPVTLTPDAGERSVTFSGQILTAGYTDYRQPNNSFTRTLSWTSKPDIRLSSAAVVPRVVSSSGVVDLFLTVDNHSLSTAASGVQLTLGMPAGYVISDSDGLSCSGTVCTIGALTAGQSLALHLVLGSAGLVSGPVSLSLAAGNGDFPTGDTAATPLVVFDVVVTPGHHGGGGGGGALAPVWLCVLLLARRLRGATLS